MAGIGFIAEAPLTQRSYERRRWENEDDCKGREEERRRKRREKKKRRGEEATGEKEDTYAV
jgi:hypothetical protein